MVFDDGRFWQNYPTRVSRIHRILFHITDHPKVSGIVLILFLLLTLYAWGEERALIHLVLAIKGAFAVWYWNLDLVFGRKWTYLSGAHFKLHELELIENQNSGKNQNLDLLHISILIDIIDLGMWAVPSFSIYFSTKVSQLTEEYGAYAKHPNGWTKKSELRIFLSDLSGRLYKASGHSKIPKSA